MRIIQGPLSYPEITDDVLVERRDEARKLREQSRLFYNAASLKMKHARCMRAEEKKYYTAASKKLEKILVSQEGNTNITNIGVPERQASIKARAALKKQKIEKQI